jgi:hypothetical protein
MKRRTLFGLPLVGLFGWRRQQPLAPPAAPIIDPRSRPAPFGPTMLDLVGLAKSDPHARGIYDRLLTHALRETGPVAVDWGDPVTIFHCGGFPSAKFGHVETLIRRASCVPVPESLLKHFRPENRGEEFPRGIPYVPSA